MDGFRSSFQAVLSSISLKRLFRPLANANPVSCVDRFDMREACRAVTDAFNIAMECDAAQIYAELEKFPVEVAGYAYEGAALAIGANASMGGSWERLTDFTLSASVHQMNAASGCGGAFAHAGVSLSSIPADVDPFWRWTLVDGYAFHQAFFNAQQIIREQEQPEVGSAWERRAYNQGIGRAIWYAAGGKPDLIRELINQFAPWQRSDLWYGVGLQAGYCGGVEREFQQMRAKSGKQLDGLSSGVAMAVVTRSFCDYFPDHTTAASSIICGASTADVVKLFKKTLAQAEESNKPELFLELRTGMAQTMLA